MRVFISHTVRDNRDLGLADAVAARLSERGVDAFLAPGSIRPGDDWERTLREELGSRCTHFFLIYSHAASLPDSYVGREIELARARPDLVILQYVPGDLKPPFPELQRLPYYEDRDELLDEICARLGAPSAPQPFDAQSLLAPPQMTRGLLASMLCDRRVQADEFQSAFDRSVGDCLPQMYVAHGPRQEGHDSLVDRLVHLPVQRYAVTKHGAEAKVTRLRVAWPAETPSSVGLENVLSRLFAEIDAAYLYDRSLQVSAEDWLRIAVRGEAVVVVEHTLFSSGWSCDATRVLRGYVEFWRRVGQARPAVPFVIFFKAVYDHEPEDSWWKRRALRSAMDDVTRAERGGSLHATRLAELRCVRRDHVEEWFRERAVGYGLTRYLRHCDELFATVACRRMGEVEIRLRAVQDEMRFGGNA